MAIPLANPVCPTCDEPLVYSTLHGRYALVCPNYPMCSVFCSVDQATKAPTSVPGDAETRALRVQLHELFDPLWKRHASADKRRRERLKLYRWMAKAMGIPQEDAHFALFSTEMCRKVLPWVNALVESMKERS